MIQAISAPDELPDELMSCLMSCQRWPSYELHHPATPQTMNLHFSVFLPRSRRAIEPIIPHRAQRACRRAETGLEISIVDLSGCKMRLQHP
jgi:hypothetical protein